MLIDTFMDPANDDVILVATGPLTNVALALVAEPRLATRIRRLVLISRTWKNVRVDEYPSDLAGIRSAIDAVDGEVVRLLATREALVRRAAPLKADADSVRAPARAEAVISRARRLAEREGATPEVVERIYRSIVQSFIDLELSEHRQRDQPAR
jgi:isochorismate pyruvate lyase